MNKPSYPSIHRSISKKRILFSGIIMAGIGAALGLVLVHLAKTPYTSKHYRSLQRVYIIIGATGGFLYGASVSAVGQLEDLQKQQDQLLLDQQQHPHDINT